MTARMWRLFWFWLACFMLGSFPVVIYAESTQPVVIGEDLTAVGLVALAGSALSLLLAYAPGLAEWYAAQDKWKPAIMAAFLVLTAAGIFALSCGNIISVGIMCDERGIWKLVLMLFTALSSNQGTYLLAVKPFAKIKDVTPPAPTSAPET